MLRRPAKPPIRRMKRIFPLALYAVSSSRPTDRATLQRDRFPATRAGRSPPISARGLRERGPRPSCGVSLPPRDLPGSRTSGRRRSKTPDDEIPQGAVGLLGPALACVERRQASPTAGIVRKSARLQPESRLGLSLPPHSREHVTAQELEVRKRSAPRGVLELS